MSAPPPFPLPRRVAIGGLAALLAALACGPARGPASPDVVAGTPRVLPEHYAHSIAALGMPGARRAFQVGHGSVIGNGDAAIEWRLASAVGPVRVSPVFFETDGVPVAHWWMVTARESVAFEAAAAPCAALGDTSLLLSVRATATWLADLPGEVEVESRLRTRADPPAPIPWDAEDADTFVEHWQGRFALRNGRLVAGVDPTLERVPADPRARGIAPTRGPGPGILAATGRARLARGEQRRWHWWMPVYPTTVPGAGIERFAGHDRIAGETRAAWRRLLGQGAAFTTPDSLVNAAWRAALVTLLMGHERDQGEWVPLGNPLQYRDVWLRDAARLVRALAIAGHGEMARSDVRTLRRFQLPNGALLSQQGQLDGTGQWLWAAAQAHGFPPGAADRDLVPTIRHALVWLETQTTLTDQLELRFAGMLPYADPRDNELVRAQLTGNDAWAIAGLAAAGPLARRAGHDSLAAALESLAALYRVTFARALARSGARDVPASWQGIGRDWGNVAVSWPLRVLADDDPRMAALAERIWRRSGGPGLVTVGPPDSLHTYLGADLAQWSLLAGRPAAARAYVAAMLRHASSTLGHAEVFHRVSGDYGLNLPPHATASATLLDLLRTMVVCDVRDTLELALGGDPAWWRGTRIERAPTRFGVVDVTLESPAPDRRRARFGAVDVPVRVRVADGERLVAVRTRGARALGNRWVEVPPGGREVEFQVAADGGARR